MKERSIITFTILCQTAVGAFLTLILMRFWLIAQVGKQVADGLSDPIFAGIIIILIIGVLTSLLHLGNPQKAWRSLSNLKNSWLSREILFTLMFAISASVYAGLQILNLAPQSLQYLFEYLALICGLTLIYSMTHVYMLQTVPSWVNRRTWWSFITSSLLLGSLFCCTIYIPNWINNPAAHLLDADLYLTLETPTLWVSFTALILIGIEIVFALIAPVHASNMPAPMRILQLSPQHIKMLRLGIMLSAVCAILIFLLCPSATLISILAILVAFISSLAALTLERAQFYDSRNPIL